jgi:hypothetical protein
MVIDMAAIGSIQDLEDSVPAPYLVFEDAFKRAFHF